MTDYASCLLQLAFLFKTSYILAFPPKSEFVESERKLKSNRFRHFIYVKLRTAVDRCKNLPLMREVAKRSFDGGIVI